MKFIFTLQYLDPDTGLPVGEQIFYTTLHALFTEHGRERLRVSKSRLSKVIPKELYYKNRYCEITKAPIYNRFDAVKRKEEFENK